MRNHALGFGLVLRPLLLLAHHHLQMPVEIAGKLLG